MSAGPLILAGRGQEAGLSLAHQAAVYTQGYLHQHERVPVVHTADSWALHNLPISSRTRCMIFPRRTVPRNHAKVNLHQPPSRRIAGLESEL
jgi:hypothetical protein